MRQSKSKARCQESERTGNEKNGADLPGELFLNGFECRFRRSKNEHGRSTRLLSTPISQAVPTIPLLV
jgi:hypothetical protein